jgi:DNA-binding response OmpR family regulator
MKDGISSYNSNVSVLHGRGGENPADLAVLVPERLVRGTVLIVDDEILLLQLLTEMFEAEGFEVLAATNSVDALISFHKHKNSIDIAIVDLGLPVVSGWELINLMKAVNYDLKSVIMTSFIEHYSKNEIFSPSIVADVFIKPFNPYDLIEKIKTLL